MRCILDAEVGLHHQQLRVPGHRHPGMVQWLLLVLADGCEFLVLLVVSLGFGLGLPLLDLEQHVLVMLVVGKLVLLQLELVAQFVLHHL